MDRMGSSLYLGLGGICSIVSLVCWVIVLIDAFKNEVWKGIVGFICGLYLLYYAFAEYESENKTAVLVGWLASSALGFVFYRMGMSSMAIGRLP